MAVFVATVAAVVLGPFALFGASTERWSLASLESTPSAAIVAAIVFGLLAADIVAPVPSSLVCVAAGTSLGAATGAVVCALGLTCGCVVGLWLGARVGSPGARRLLHAREYAALKAALHRYGLVMLVFCRPVPVLAEVSVLVAGASGAPRLRAVTVTATANVGVASAYAVLGAAADDAASFGLVFAASCLLPALGWLGVRAVSARPAVGTRPAPPASPAAIPEAGCRPPEPTRPAGCRPPDADRPATG